MIAYLFYNVGTDGERAMASLASQLDRLRVDNKLVDADSTEGIRLTGAYDILGRPAVAIVGPSGIPIQSWQGGEIPSVADLSYYAHQGLL